MAERSDRVIQQERAANARVEDSPAIFGCVPAVDAAAGQIDAEIAVFEFRDPIAASESVPHNDTPGSRAGCAAYPSRGNSAPEYDRLVHCRRGSRFAWCSVTR